MGLSRVVSVRGTEAESGSHAFIKDQGHARSREQPRAERVHPAMAAQEPVERPPGGSNTVVNDATGYFALLLIEGVAQAFSPLVGGNLRRRSRTGSFLLPPDVLGRRPIKHLLHNSVDCRGHEPGG